MTPEAQPIGSVVGGQFTQLDYYIDYEVFYEDGSSELKEESIMARNKDEALKIVEQVLSKTEDGRETNIIDIRQLW